MKERRHIEIHGIVQGVGFRPFVYSLATRAGLTGQVLNDGAGVMIEVEGEAPALDRFIVDLEREAPPLAVISHIASTRLHSKNGADRFTIAPSQDAGPHRTLVSPDVALCDDCLHEMWDPNDRRCRYPFINCTNCGPRFTIIEHTPYDRPATTMRAFIMCPACRAEYEDPADRRFHAQPNACPACGPQVQLKVKNRAAWPSDPFEAAAAMLAAGYIVALKGLGGFHLACDAGREDAVARVRALKQRGEKPLAVMARDAAAVQAICAVNEQEMALLTGHQRPVVILRRRAGGEVAPSLAPGQITLGVMLPYTPLHHLLLAALPGRLLVMTSANRSGEPIIFQGDDPALSGLADAVLDHDREIFLPCDDAVTYVPSGRPVLLRRARGYAPSPLTLAFEAERPVLAVGGQLKNSVCLLNGEQAFLSQYIGDLGSAGSAVLLRRVIRHFENLFGIQPAVIAHDLHPDYHATHLALERASRDGLETIGVQHHHAHIASVMAEHELVEPVIGAAFDGSGYGPDGSVWGGEFMTADLAGYERRAWLRPIPLPGGEQAVRQPWRMAAVWLDEIYGAEWPLSPAEMGWPDAAMAGWPLVRQLIERRVNSPLTSSMGRLFDAAASLVGVRHAVTYEGQAAIELEALADSGAMDGYEFGFDGRVIDPRPVIHQVVEDRLRGVSVPVIAGRFHAGVARMVCEVCVKLREQTGLKRVALSGGVFQNRLLLERSLDYLWSASFERYINERVPPNDGGLALGQAAVAANLPPPLAPPPHRERGKI